MFAALLAPSVLSLLTTTFTDPRERGRAFGIYASIAISGAAFGLILGGLLTQYLSWRWCLYVNLPIAGLVALGATTMIPSRTGNAGIKLDIPGAILGCGGLVSIVYALGEAAADGWHSSGVIGPLIGGLLLLACFVVWQAKGPHPLLPLRVLKNRNRAGSFLTIMLAQIGLFGTFLFLTYLLQTVDHFSPVKTGLAFLPLMAVNGLAATQLASRLMPHVRTRLLVTPGLLAGALGVGLLTRLHPGASYVTYVLPAEILLGLGFGIALVPCISTATNNADPRDVGITSAMTNTSQQIGASIGTALLNTIAATVTASYLALHASTDHVVAAATVHGYAVASGWAAGILVLAAVVGGVMIDAHPGRRGQRWSRRTYRSSCESDERCPAQGVTLIRLAARVASAISSPLTRSRFASFLGARPYPIRIWRMPCPYREEPCPPWPSPWSLCSPDSARSPPGRAPRRRSRSPKTS